MNEHNNAGEKDISIKPIDGTQPLLLSDFIAFVSGVIPNTKYFDSNFDRIQVQIDELRKLNDMFSDQITKLDYATERRFEQVDKRFEQIDKRFEQVDKRFEQADENLKYFKNDVDKRFEQADENLKDFKNNVDKRFEQMINSIDRLGDKLDRRDSDQRGFYHKNVFDSYRHIGLWRVRSFFEDAWNILIFKKIVIELENKKNMEVQKNGCCGYRSGVSTITR